MSLNKYFFAMTELEAETKTGLLKALCGEKGQKSLSEGSKEQKEGFVESTGKYALICAQQRKGKDPQRRFHPLTEVCLRVLFWRMFCLDCQVEQH